MTAIQFLRSPLGRVLRVVTGLGLIAFGAAHPSLVGIVLMMVGIVPVVTGCAGICLLDEFARGREHRFTPHRPREGQA
jgi:hypothetical protein